MAEWSCPPMYADGWGWKTVAACFLNESEFGLELSSVYQRVSKAQAFYEEASKGKPSFTVEDFLEQKRADAALEKY